MSDTSRRGFLGLMTGALGALGLISTTKQIPEIEPEPGEWPLPNNSDKAFTTEPAANDTRTPTFEARGRVPTHDAPPGSIFLDSRSGALYVRTSQAAWTVAASYGIENDYS